MIKRIYIVIALLIWGGSSFAAELWVPHLMAIDGGYGAGALPPPGVYLINSTAYASGDIYNGKGSTGTHADVFVEIPEIAWVTPYTVFGAQYLVGMAQPMSSVTVKPNGQNGGNLSNTGQFATVIFPYFLSWNLGNGLHIATRLNIYIPDGNWRNPTTHEAGNFNGIDFYSFEPSASVSWLKDGWNLTFKVFSNINSSDRGFSYRSGTVIGTEETISKQIGKWTVGINGASVQQVTDDTGSMVSVLDGPGADGHRVRNFTAGPFVGYDFGRVKVAGWYDTDFGTRNTVGGATFFTRIIIATK